MALLPLLLLLACDLQFPPSFPFFCPLERVATATIAAHHTTQWSRKFKGDKGAIERKNHCKNWCKKRFSHPVLGAVFLDGQILTSFPLFFFTRSRQLFFLEKQFLTLGLPPSLLPSPFPLLPPSSSALKYRGRREPIRARLEEYYTQRTMPKVPF